MEEWERLDQRVIDNTVKQWHKCLLSCVASSHDNRYSFMLLFHTLYNMNYSCNITHFPTYTCAANELIAGTDNANLQQYTHVHTTANIADWFAVLLLRTISSDH